MSETVNKCSRGELAAAAARGRHQAHNLLLGQFKASGLSMVALAERAALNPADVEGILRFPRNVDIDTFSKLLFAVNGSAPLFGVEWPRKANPSPAPSLYPAPAYDTKLGEPPAFRG